MSEVNIETEIKQLRMRNIQLELHLERLTKIAGEKDHIKQQAALIVRMSKMERFISNNSPLLYKGMNEYLETFEPKVQLTEKHG